MDFQSYLKTEIEKSVFIEISRDLTLNIKGNPVLKRGDYPILPEDIVTFAKEGIENLPTLAIIKAMLYIIACDPDFKYSKDYKNILSSIDGIEHYIIMEIEKNKETNTKKAVIFATALIRLNPKKEFQYNRILLIMKLYDKTNLEFLEDEIVASLEKLKEDFPKYTLADFHLGEYYLNKDIDKAKIYLRRCLEDPTTSEEASILLEKMKNVEEYDKAVDLVKEGQGLEALKILIPYIEDNPERLDAQYFAAVAYRQIGNHHKALMYLNELLTIGGERLEVYSEIALNLAALGDFEGALVYFKKALKIMPDDAGIICNIGVCHLNLGEIEEARRAFELSSRLNPKDEIPKMWLERLKNII